MLDEVIWVTGAVCVAYLHYLIFWVLYSRFLTKPTDWSKYRGEWAIVTGASYGIGLALAEQLAAKKINVVVIARSKVCQDLQKKYQVQARYILADFQTDASCYERIKKETEALNISILVNNAGGGVDPFKEFLEYTEKEEEEVRLLNEVPTLKLCRIFLPKMIQRRKGAIVNISSAISKYSPFIYCYASSKAKINSVSQALAVECRKYDVIVQSMLVGYVSTPSAGNPAISLSCPSSSTVAEATLDIFGKTSDHELSPYWFHAIQLFFMTTVAPAWLMKMVMEKEKARVRENYHKNK